MNFAQLNKALRNSKAKARADVLPKQHPHYRVQIHGFYFVVHYLYHCLENSATRSRPIKGT